MYKITKQKGKYSESIEIMEKILQNKKEQYGEDSVEVNLFQEQFQKDISDGFFEDLNVQIYHVKFNKGIEKLSQLLNVSAMLSLEAQQYDQSLEKLKKSEMLQNNSLKMKAVTYNNMACYYRRINKLRTAHNYLLNALEIELKLEDNDVTLADTHLNLCAVLSQLDRHSEALEHSMLSIILIQEQLLNTTLTYYKNTQSNEQTENITKKRKLVVDDRITVLSIAYHNLGVEFEHLKRDDESMKLYLKARNMATNFLGVNHSVVKKMEKVMQKAQSQVIYLKL